MAYDSSFDRTATRRRYERTTGLIEENSRCKESRDKGELKDLREEVGTKACIFGKIV